MGTALLDDAVLELKPASAERFGEDVQAHLLHLYPFRRVDDSPLNR